MKQKCVSLAKAKTKIPSKIDTLQVCLPCGNQEKFAEIVAGYVDTVSSQN